MPAELLHVLSDFIVVIEHADSIATICRLSWLEDPELLLAFGSVWFRTFTRGLKCFELWVELETGCRWHQVSLRHVIEHV